MLYIFYGDDITRVRADALKKAHACVVGDGVPHLLTTESGGEEMLKDAIGATSLFRSHEVFILDTFSEDEVLFSAFLRLAAELVQSPNTFVAIEHTLGAKDVRSLLDDDATVVEYAKKTKKEWNPFGLSDALVSRDKKALWILLQEAWREGRTSEELIGTLHWQLKMLRLAKTTKSAVEAGQKPFVYDKAKRGLRHFREGEITRLSHDLIVRYHEGHIGKRNIDHALEAWVLSL